MVNGKKIGLVVVAWMMVLRDCNGKFLGSRYQLPISLGYAVAVHRVLG
jgi:hypothetical protein